MNVRHCLLRQLSVGWQEEGSRIIIGKEVYQDSFSVLIFPSFCFSEDFEGGAVPVFHSLYRQDEGFVILRAWTLSTPV